METGTGRKSIQISPWGLAKASKELQKSLWSFQTYRLKTHIVVSGRLYLMCTRDKKSNSLEGKMQTALGRMGPAFLGGGDEQGKS